ncbi:hypothetical protein [Endozoicomonas sp. 4G]|uniref:hypothetical protein n=1 Tax=Endozoicomonas sp. 4G TaxID=2872754 RepID=UPI002078B951|nr:hypothetical protein [Endozoicomonas sp. 4G]
MTVRVAITKPAIDTNRHPAQKHAKQQLVEPDAPDQAHGYRVDFIQRPEQELDGVVDGAGISMEFSRMFGWDSNISFIDISFISIKL